MPMETLVAKSKQPAVSRRRRRNAALVAGARSAFDISGLIVLNDPALSRHRMQGESPAGVIAGDMARITERLGRSATHALDALRKGLEIEDLKLSGVVDRNLRERPAGPPASRDGSPKHIR